MGWPFGGQKKPSAGEEEIVSARPDEDEPVPIAISPISVRSGEDELECGETKIVVFPTPMQLTESSEVGDDPTKGRHDAALRPSSGGAHRMALSFPPHRPGTGSDRGDDRNSRPSSGARSTRSQLPGETDNEEEDHLLEVPEGMLLRSRPGSAPNILVPVEESLSNDGLSPQKDTSCTSHFDPLHLGDDSHSRGMQNAEEECLVRPGNTAPPSRVSSPFKAESVRTMSRASSRKSGSSSRMHQDESNSSRLTYVYAISVGVVVVALITIIAVVTAPKKGTCEIGEYYGLRINSTGSSQGCVPCPIGQSSEGGTRDTAKCFCTSGYYTPDAAAPHTPASPIPLDKCVACDRGLWTPSRVAIGRRNCQRYSQYWRLGDYGVNCRDTCKAFNMSLDPAGLRLWEQRFSMQDVLNMIAYQINVTCSHFALSYRNAGPFVCAHPDCGDIEGICYAPAPPIKTDEAWVTPKIIRRFCPCYDLASMQKVRRTWNGAEDEIEMDVVTSEL